MISEGLLKVFPFVIGAPIEGYQLGFAFVQVELHQHLSSAVTVEYHLQIAGEGAVQIAGPIQAGLGATALRHSFYA